LRAPTAIPSRLGGAPRRATVGSRLDPAFGSARRRRRRGPRLSLRPACSESPAPWTLLHQASLRGHAVNIDVDA
jgi:hypothetical protein